VQRILRKGNAYATSFFLLSYFRRTGRLSERVEANKTLTAAFSQFYVALQAKYELQLKKKL